MTDQQVGNEPEFWQYAVPKLWVPRVTQGRKPKLNWNRQTTAEDILTQRRNQVPEDFFDQ